jgi:hypothetical protein
VTGLTNTTVTNRGIVIRKTRDIFTASSAIFFHPNEPYMCRHLYASSANHINKYKYYKIRCFHEVVFCVMASCCLGENRLFVGTYRFYLQNSVLGYDDAL